MISSGTFADIIEFSIVKHKGQTRKGDGSPYISHPMSVAHRVKKLKKKSKNVWFLAGSAMLHDTVEDTDTTVDEIAERFGHHVAALVAELTLDKTQYEKIGKTRYLSEHMTGMSSYALTVKLCDRLDNVLDMEDMDEEFINRYHEETIAILTYLQRNRKLTKTQRKLVKKIYKALKTYE